MTASRSLAVCLVLSSVLAAQAQDPPKDQSPGSGQSASQSTPSQSEGQSQDQPEGSSSSQPSHPKHGTNSTPAAQHHKVRVEEDSESPQLKQAEDSIQKQDYAGAERFLRKAVELDPANYVGWFDLGFVENALEKTAESIAAYRKSVAAKPDVFESNLNLGLQLAKTGQPDAEQFLRGATRLKPTSHPDEGQFRAWLSLGHVLEKSKPAEALAAYQHAQSLQPKNPEPRLSAGLLLEQAGRFADAEQEYKETLALDPKSSDALVGLANLSMRGHKFAEAEEYLRRLLIEQPNSGAAKIQLGRVLAAEGKNDDAIAELEAGIKLTVDAAAPRELADLYATAGKNEQAEAAYRALLAASPNEAQLHRGLGKALLRQKKFGEAEQEFLATVKLKPDIGEAYGDLAFAASENKEYPLVIRALEARAKLLPEEPITYFLRASAYDHLHDLKQAIVYYHLFLNTAGGKYPDQEWQAKHRLITFEPKK